MESTVQRRRRLGLCYLCGKKSPKSMKSHKSCRAKIKVYYADRKERCRTQCFKMYGGKCVCCGESNYKFLTLDHINNDGYKEKTKGNKLYSHIVTKGKRNDLQLLCWNCNCGRNLNGGICPHTESI